MDVARRVAGAAVLAAALAAVAGAATVVPAKHTAFTGVAVGKVILDQTFTARDPVDFSTSRTGTQLLGFTYTDNACDETAVTTFDIGTLRVSRGAFSLLRHHSAHLPDALEDGGTIVVTTSVTGKFTTARKVTGTLSYSLAYVSGGAGRCGPITLRFTAKAK